MITHSLIKSKFKYFAEVAKSISSFLVTFQTDNPVVLLLAADRPNVNLRFLEIIKEKKEGCQS